MTAAQAPKTADPTNTNAAILALFRTITPVVPGGRLNVLSRGTKMGQDSEAPFHATRPSGQVLHHTESQSVDSAVREEVVAQQGTKGTYVGGTAARMIKNDDDDDAGRSRMEANAMNDTRAACRAFGLAVGAAASELSGIWEASVAEECGARGTRNKVQRTAAAAAATGGMDLLSSSSGFVLHRHTSADLQQYGGFSLSAAMATAGPRFTQQQKQRRYSMATSQASAAAGTAPVPTTSSSSDAAAFQRYVQLLREADGGDDFSLMGNTTTTSSRDAADLTSTADGAGGGGGGGLLAIKQAVSQKKKRFQEDGFDLDLTYITKRVIAMGFPASGREGLYRNHVEDVEKFFNKYHNDHYRIYNLCIERLDYDSPGRFGGNYRRFPFQDHNAPTQFALIYDICLDMKTFLQADSDNVVAVHCKAGKGRTGLIVSCFLMTLMPELRAASDALKYFSQIRTHDGKGVTIPSQIRYCHYWDEYLSAQRGVLNSDWPRPPTSALAPVYSLTRLSVGQPGWQGDFYFKILVEGCEIFDSRGAGGKAPPSKTHFDNHKCAYIFDFTPHSADGDAVQHSESATSTRHGHVGGRAGALPPLLLSGDIAVKFYEKSLLLADSDLFRFWFNTAFVDLHSHGSDAEAPAVSASSCANQQSAAAAAAAAPHGAAEVSSLTQQTKRLTLTHTSIDGAVKLAKFAGLTIELEMCCAFRDAASRASAVHQGGPASSSSVDKLGSGAGSVGVRSTADDATSHTGAAARGAGGGGNDSSPTSGGEGAHSQFRSAAAKVRMLNIFGHFGKH